MAAVKKWGVKEIEYLRTRFEDVNGKIYWKTGQYKGKLAGWICSATGYRRIRFDLDGRIIQVFAHRVMWALHNDTVPDVLDHIDRNRDNNNISNLRISNTGHNNRNRGGKVKNKSGMVGVTLRESGRYRVRHNCKNIGTFDTFEEACRIKQDLIDKEG